ncbi:MAG: DUF2147 domain-containing protein [Pseudomonadota bacterium]
MMKFKKALASAVVAGAASIATAGVGIGSAYAAEPIVGTWKRSTGTLIKYSGKGSTYCGTVLNGEFKGKSIGCLSGKNGKYKGKVKDLAKNKTYTGKGSVNGNTLSLAGCVFGICRSEDWKRQ